MDTLTVRLQFPRDLLGALEVPQERLEARLRELIVLQLFREGRISSGKGAELLGDFQTGVHPVAGTAWNPLFHRSARGTDLRGADSGAIVGEL